MTITYQKDVATCRFLGFGKLLAKWKGSLYKLIFREMLVYAAAYSLLSILYRNFMTEDQRRVFEQVCLYCNQTADLIPLSFFLGFFVTFVVTRWWNQFINLPWPDRLIYCVTMYVSGSDERGCLLRRTLMRYVNLCTVLLFQTISVAVKKRFPTCKHLVEAGFMTSEERFMWETLPTKVNKHWVPLIWFINLLDVACKEGRVQTGPPVKHILEEINELRSKTSLLWGHDWVTVPLVYTQVVTLTTHLFFVACTLGRQYLDPQQNYTGHDLDLYFPFFTFLQFLFFMGWLKVAEQLINPFGEDDDDFETNWVIDRNIQVSYLAVDEMYGKLPKLEKDIHWGKNDPHLPYTEAALVHKIPTYMGSTMHIVVPPKDQGMVFESDHHSDSNNISNFASSLSDFFCPLPCFRPGDDKLEEGRSLKSLKNWTEIDNSNLKSTRTLGSSTSLFEDTYLQLLNRGSRKDSIISRGSRGSGDYAYLTIPDSSSPTSTQIYLKRHRASMDRRPTLTRLSEEDQEDSYHGYSHERESLTSNISRHFAAPLEEEEEEEEEEEQNEAGKENKGNSALQQEKH